MALAVAGLITACGGGGGSGDGNLSANALQSSRVQLTIPAPTGQYAVGMTWLHLVDNSRLDPYFPTTQHAREIMVQLWYPAQASDHALSPWMSSAVLPYYRKATEDALSGTNLGSGGGNNVTCPPGVNTGPCADNNGNGIPDGQEGPGSGGGPTIAPVSLAGVDFPFTHARLIAAVESSGQPYPIVIYTPGHGDNGEQGTAWAEELASHGYIVISFGSTYEALAVEFPNARVELVCNKKQHADLVSCDNGGSPTGPDAFSELKLRRMDAQFVIDKLTAYVAAGTNPDAEQRALPDGLRASLNLSKIGIFGHSLGGGVAASALANDSRFSAGINLDGAITLLEDVGRQPPTDAPPADQQAYDDAVYNALVSLGTRIGNRSYMIMSSPTGSNPLQDVNLPHGGVGYVFFSNLSGLKRWMVVAKSEHGTFTDSMWMYPQLADAGLIYWTTSQGPSVANAVGTMSQEHGVALVRAYILSFFDRSLKNVDNHLLDAASSQYPEVTVYQ